MLHSQCRPALAPVQLSSGTQTYWPIVLPARAPQVSHRQCPGLLLSEALPAMMHLLAAQVRTSMSG